MQKLALGWLFYSDKKYYVTPRTWISHQLKYLCITLDIRITPPFNPLYMFLPLSPQQINPHWKPLIKACLEEQIWINHWTVLTFELDLPRRTRLFRYPWCGKGGLKLGSKRWPGVNKPGFTCHGFTTLDWKRWIDERYSVTTVFTHRALLSNILCGSDIGWLKCLAYQCIDNQWIDKPSPQVVEDRYVIFRVITESV